jgi:branched-chain amino acid aminotransferase
MVDAGRYFWKDGELLEHQALGSVSILTHTLHYGLGAFEGIRAYRGAGGTRALFRLREHVTRLFDSARLAQLEPRVSLDAVEDGAASVLRENGLDEGYVRPLVFLGAGAMGLLPSDNPVVTVVVAWPWGAYLGDEGLAKGIRCKISSYSRHSLGSALPRGKIIGQYVNSTLAKREAKLAGFDEALLLDGNGFVCEGSGENLFVVKNGRLVTPPLWASILSGITRDTVMTLAAEEGLTVVEEPITRDSLYLADEVFLTGTAAEVTPVREIDGRAIGRGSRGPVTERLQKLYFDAVRGADDSHPEWLTRF